MAIERSSDKHGPLHDDELKKEVEGMVRAGRPTRAEEWHDPEPVEDENSPEEAELIERRRAAEAGRGPGDPPGGDAAGGGGEEDRGRR